MGGAQYIMYREFITPWVGVQNALGKESDIPWVGVSKYHG
jgi:hypothetical protein